MPIRANPLGDELSAVVFWAVSAVRFADRILDPQRDPKLAENLPDPLVRQLFDFEAEAESAFLLIAIRSLRRAFLRYAKIIGDRPHSGWIEGDPMFGEITDARDILEHFDEYAAGTGNLQKRGRLGPNRPIFKLDPGPPPIITVADFTFLVFGLKAFAMRVAVTLAMDHAGIPEPPDLPPR